MFQRKTKSHIKNLLQTQFLYVQEQEFDTLEGTEKLKGLQYCNTGSTYEHIMTRKTRTRRPRIHSIQSGYCAICHLPYNSIEDHINSKRHLKLIGEDANYISLNGFNLHQDTSIDSFLNLNGIETISANETEIDRDFLAKSRKNMPRTRAASVCKNVKPSPLSPTGSDISGHHLRSRRNINYMTPPLEDDSLSEKPEPDSPIEIRGLRSSARISAKLLVENDEVWNSGRPKRSCLRQKRLSVDLVDSKNPYRMEIMSTKLRSSSVRCKDSEVSTKRQYSPKRDDVDDRHLLSKYKKKRNSELIRLNNEATNFLFPKKDDSSDDDDLDTTTSSVGKNNSTIVLSSDNEDVKSPSTKFKIDDEASMDSSCSETKQKKKRRTHAEAFITDNQKYYKFETPGSRLRYHGPLASSAITGAKSPRNNGDAVPVVEPVEPINCDAAEEEEEDLRINFENYQYSFETVPKKEAWFNTFERQDRGEMNYNFVEDSHYWNSFVLPYQIGPLPPLNPKSCYSQYKQILNMLNDPPSCSTSGDGATPDPSASNSSSSMDVQEHFNNEDSKISTTTLSSTCTMDESEQDGLLKRRGLKRPRFVPTTPPGKNPRKSPRQHASTLAILSSLIHQRKRKPKDTLSLPTIPEEPVVKSPSKKLKKQPDYVSMTMEMDRELDMCLEETFDELDLAVGETVDIHKCKVTVKDILMLYDEAVKKENVHSTRRFFNGSPGRKLGRRKKKNKTGWPNKNNRRIFVRKIEQSSVPTKDGEEEEEDNADDTVSIILESDDECEDDEEDELEMNSTTDSINKTDLNIDSTSVCEKTESDNCDLTNSSDRVVVENVLTNKVTNSSEVDVQIVFMPKAEDGEKLVVTNKSRRGNLPKRASRRQRRMPGSPKSPRMLRKPRGRWYRER